MVRGGLALPFTCLGEEDLHVAGQTHRVKALLAVTPDYRAALLDAAQSNGFPSSFPTQLQDMLGNGTASTQWNALRQVASEHGHDRDENALPKALAQLFNLGDAIPLKR